MKKILLVFGTRPEAIKMAPVVRELKNYPEVFDTRVCVTAQHREMLDQVLRIFNIMPDYDLNIMAANQDLFDITSKVLCGVGNILKSFDPDVVLVHGDTTTSMAAALASFYLKIKVGHVEAGLRTNNLCAPWPEEMNRQVTDRIADFYFAPTVTSQKNLLKENIPENKIFVTGNTVIDALLIAAQIIENDPELENGIHVQLKEFRFDISRSLNEKRKFILVTGHRRENFGEGFLNICKALVNLAENHPEIDIVYPVHLNPNVQKPVFELLSDYSNIYLIPPVDYLPFIYLLKYCYLVLTDSGGVQEEAPSLGKPVLVMREVTERPEAVDAGTVLLVGTDPGKIVFDINRLLRDSDLYDRMSRAINPYGDGFAAQKIADALLHHLD